MLTLTQAAEVTSPATGITAYAWLLVALPAFGAAVLLIGGKRTDKFGPLLAVGLSWAAFLVGFVIWLQMLGRPTEQRPMILTLYSWIPAGQFNLEAGMLVDQLSIAFVLLVTFVGSLILVYSLGYMEHDVAKRRFFAYLNLFVASMLLLVLADSYLLLYVGWEGVGLASYLLIGFWNYNPAYATAANKAFIANRVGDVGLSVAIMTMFWQFGAVDFASVNAGVGHASQGAVTAIGLFLLLGACGKSAQFPLQSWLGDAMAGPTPVSALIHAATMVTAGVYLIVRSNQIFDVSETARLVVAIVGTITLLFGAIVGCAKDDIKKALAASTMSQIGYMMLAAGLGPIGYAFAIFHLLTHGFFKAGMFLGAGSVMHAMNDQVNMRFFGALGGLRKAVIPITFWTFLCGWLAILGVPPFSGFWSKDKIIESAFVGTGWQPWVFGGAALHRCRHHRFLHVAAVLHDLLRQAALDRRRPPPRVPVADDRPDDRAGLRVGVPRRHPRRDRLDLRVAQPGVRDRRADRGPPGHPRAGDHDSDPAAGLPRSRVRMGALRARRGPDGCSRRLPGYPGGSGRPVPGRRQRGRVHAPRHPPLPSLGVHRQRRRRRRGHRHRPDGRRRLLTTTKAAEWLCQVLRTGDARGGRRYSRRGVGDAVMSNLPWLTITGAIPLVGALVVWLLPSGSAARARVVALAFSLLTLVSGILATVAFTQSTEGGQFKLTEQHSWIPQFGVSYALGVDGIALSLILMSLVLTPICLLAAWRDLPEDQLGTARGKSYFALLLVLETFMVGVFAATDVFLFYVFFEAMLIPVYFLIGQFGGARRQYAAVKFLIFSLVGGLIMLAAVIGLYVQGPGGPQGFLVQNLTGLPLDVTTGRLLFVGFFFAFAVKAPMVPVHTWLPDAATEATPATATLLVGVLDKVGTYGMIRFCLQLFPEASHWATPTVIVLAVVSVLYGALLAIGQTDMMRLIAYTSVSHFGFIVLGIFAMTTTGFAGSTLYMVNHGFTTAALFLFAAMLVNRGGSKRIADYGGWQRVTPVLAGSFLVAGLSGLALPGMGAFVAEFLTLAGAFQRYPVPAVVATTGIILAAIYILWMYKRVYTGPVPDTAAGTPDLGSREKWVVAPLIALFLVLGFYPKPALDVINPAVSTTLKYVGVSDPPPVVPVAEGSGS